YIEGRPLDRFAEERGLGIRERLRLFADVCDAVSTAHQHGVIHRDLKPGNIMIDASGAARILDFGLAKVSADGESGAAGGGTMTGQFIGSLPWASPEQAAGRHAEIDVRSDVYSLGVILYHLVTGQFPYSIAGDIGRAMATIQSDEPARPRMLSREIDVDLEIIILKSLSKEPGRRYQSVGELVRDVRRYIAGEPIEPRRPTGCYAPPYLPLP